MSEAQEFDINDPKSPGGGEYDAHPVRRPASKFSEGEEVLYGQRPAKVIAVQENGKYQIILPVSTPIEVSDSDLTKVA